MPRVPQVNVPRVTHPDVSPGYAPDPRGAFTAEAFGAGVGRAIAGLGRSLAGFAAEFQEREDAAAAVDATNRLQLFNQEYNEWYNTQEREWSDPKGTDFSNATITEYNRRAGEFVQTIPEKLQPKVNMKLLGLRGDYAEKALKTELSMQDRFFEGSVATTVSRNAEQVEADHTRLEASKDNNKELIRQTPLPAVKKQVMEQKADQMLEQRALKGELKEKLRPVDDRRISIDNLPAKAQPYKQMFIEAGARHGVDPNLLASQANAESAFSPDLIAGKRVSSAGAIGISQFMPGTAKQYGIDPRNPAQSIDAQARYMATELKKHNGDVAVALAAYNWGPANAEKWAKAGKPMGMLPKETRDYIAKITGGETIIAEVRQSPRYSNLTPDQRDAAEREAVREVKVIQVADRAVQKANVDEAKNSLYVGLHDGRYADDEIRQAREVGLLTDIDDIKKAENLLAERQKKVEKREALQTALEDNAFPWTQYDKDHKEMLDNAFELDKGVEKLGKKDNDYAMGIDLLAQRTKMVPRGVADFVHSAAQSGDASRTEYALALASRLMSHNPNIFNSHPNGEKISSAVAEFEHEQTLGFRSSQAAENMAVRQSPEGQQKLQSKLKGEDIKKVVNNNISERDIESAFSSWLELPKIVGGGVETGFNNVAKRGMTDDLAALFERFYEQNGNVDLSKKLALKQLGTLWDISEVNGHKIVTRYAPDKAAAYREIPEVGRLMAEEAIEFIKKEQNLDVPRDQIQLLPVPYAYRAQSLAATKDVYHSGQNVPYLLMWQDKDGMMHKLSRPVSFDPKQLRARYDMQQQQKFMKQFSNVPVEEVPGTVIPGRDVPVERGAPTSGATPALVGDTLENIERYGGARQTPGTPGPGPRVPTLEQQRREGVEAVGKATGSVPVAGPSVQDLIQQYGKRKR